LFKNPEQKEEREKVSYREQPTGRLGTDDCPVSPIGCRSHLYRPRRPEATRPRLRRPCGHDGGPRETGPRRVRCGSRPRRARRRAALILALFTRLFAVPLTFTWQLYFDDALTDEVHSQGFLPVGDEIRRSNRESLGAFVSVRCDRLWAAERRVVRDVRRSTTARRGWPRAARAVEPPARACWQPRLAA
jgi:hypothetical protein